MATGLLPMARRRWLVGCGAVLLVGCGFELRRAPVMPFTSIALLGFAPRSPLARELREQLSAQARVVETATQAQVVLRALAEAREKVVVASTSASQVREVQLRLRVRFRIDSGTGRDLSPEAELLLVRDLSTNETQALAKEQEEAQLYRDMQADIVAQLLRRLSAVRI